MFFGPNRAPSFIFRFHSKYGVRLLRPPRASSAVPPSAVTGGGAVHSMTSKSAVAAAGSPVARCIDAYIHYSPTDSAFAHQTLGDGLRQHYNVHFHHSDGGLDPSAALEASSRVILVASNDYMLNEVAQDELRTILERRHGGLERGVVVVVLTDSEKKHLKRHFGADCNFIRWNDSSFWKKLRFHLPEPTGSAAAGDRDPARRGGQTSEAFVAPTAPRPPRGQSDYEDDMWTYMKGAVSGSQQSHSSGGQDSSLSTRSTTDNSGTMPPQFPISTTLSMAVMGSEVTAGATNSRRKPPTTRSLRPPGKASASPAGARATGGTQQRKAASRRHIVENPLECDAEYMSVVGAIDSLARRHGVNQPLPEPIYHTLEPPSSPNEEELGGGFERQNRRPKRKKRGQGDGGSGSAVYINNDLEVVYPRRGDLRRPPPVSATASRSRNGGLNASSSAAAASAAAAAAAAGQQRTLLQMLQNAADFEDEYADQEDEELLQSELDFDTSGGQNSIDLGGLSPSGASHLGGGGGYVPSPAPGSMPRRHFAAATGIGKLAAAGQQQAGLMSSPRGQLRMADVPARSTSGSAKQAGYYI